MGCGDLMTPNEERLKEIRELVRIARLSRGEHDPDSVKALGVQYVLDLVDNLESKLNNYRIGGSDYCNECEEQSMTFFYYKTGCWKCDEKITPKAGE